MNFFKKTLLSLFLLPTNLIICDAILKIDKAITGMPGQDILVPINTIVNYTITVTNTGTAAVNPITITDVLPSGLTLLNADISATSQTGDTLSITGNTINWTIAPVNNFTSKTLTITAFVNDSFQDFVLNNFTSQITPPDTIVETTFSQILIVGTNLEFIKTVDNSNPAVGDIITFTIRVNNKENFPILAIPVSDILNSAFAIIQASTNNGSIIFPVIVASKVVPNQINLFIPQIAANSSATLTIKALVIGGAGQTIINQLSTDFASKLVFPVIKIQGSQIGKSIKKKFCK